MKYLETLKKDLILQKKKLEDLRGWGSVSILIDSQVALVEMLEKQYQERKDSGDERTNQYEVETDITAEY